VDQRNQYVRDVEIYSDCAATPRYRSRAWCECDGNVQPACTLTCDDGNPPPDLTIFEPVFQETCNRFLFEHTTLSADECPSAATLLNFDAKAFCCNEPAPENCSVCGAGDMLDDAEKIVQSEFFGPVTCGEIATHASYLPTGKCGEFIAKLLDNPFDASSECCVIDPDYVPPATDAPTTDPQGSSSGIMATSRAATVVVAVLSVLAISAL
jgi:hypothetical protein